MKCIALGAGLAAIMVLPACSTFEGFGKDISAVGRGVSHVANEVREEVFMPKQQYASVSVGQACDPTAGELDGGNGLPPCPRANQSAPVPTYLKRR